MTLTGPEGNGVWICDNAVACSERQEANARHDATMESWVTEKKIRDDAIWVLNRGFVLVMLKHEPIAHGPFVTCAECNKPYPCPTMDMARDATVEARVTINGS